MSTIRVFISLFMLGMTASLSFFSSACTAWRCSFNRSISGACWFYWRVGVVSRFAADFLSRAILVRASEAVIPST
jgi:hypothetical protein